MRGSIAGTPFFVQLSLLALLALLAIYSVTLHASQPVAVITENTPACTGNVPHDQTWTEAKVKKGDTLSHLFKRHGLDSQQAYHIARIQEAKPLVNFDPGDTIRLQKTRPGKLGWLQYRLDKLEMLNVCPAPGNNSWLVYTQTRQPEIRVNNTRAVIYSSLLAVAAETGLSMDILYKIEELFGWEVDFSRDIRMGDQLLVIYEELFLDGEKIGDGEIIATELTVAGKTRRAIRFLDEHGKAQYFAPDGSSITGTFLRSPLKFGYITSDFSNNRLHPIKKVWRAHKGIDYGAPTGTPIMATGDGVVKWARRKGGYGKTVIIRHGGVYETLYAHLSKYARNIAPGKRVKQGEIIGYVGSTGLSTGPHLHYEFRIHGVHKNPATVKFPEPAPIADKYKSQFLALASRRVEELDYLKRIPLAGAENALQDVTQSLP